MDLIIKYMGEVPKQSNFWGLIMPVVKKVRRELQAYFVSDSDADAWSLQQNVDYYVLEVNKTKLLEHLITAIEWLNKKKNENVAGS